MTITIYWREALWVLLAYFPIVFIHELGHAVAGWMMGNRGAIIRFGNPSARWHTVLPLGPLRIQLHWGPGLWLSSPVCRFEHWPARTPWRQLLFTLGGPLASALFLLFVKPDSVSDLFWWQKPKPTAQIIIQFYALWLTLAPLVPMRYPSGLQSDGLQIIMHTRDLLRPQRDLST